LASASARAGTVAGCDPAVMTAMQAVAEARVAAATAVNDAMYTMDDSVLALTCFNQAAAGSAQQAGQIFSREFSAALQPVVNDELKAMYANFVGNSLGGKSGAVDYTATQMPQDSNSSFNCDQVSKLWDTVSGSGINDGVPNVSFDLLVGGASKFNTELGGKM